MPVVFDWELIWTIKKGLESPVGMVKAKVALLVVAGAKETAVLKPVAHDCGVGVIVGV